MRISAAGEILSSGHVRTVWVLLPDYFSKYCVGIVRIAALKEYLAK